MSPETVLDLSREHDVEFLDLRFTDYSGRWQHVTAPAAGLTPERLEQGFRVTGQAADAPVLLAVPDGRTARLDPFCQYATLGVICDLKDAASGADYIFDARAAARRSAALLGTSAHCDEMRVGFRLEFFIFDQACFDQGVNGASYRVEAAEGAWRRGRNEPDNLGQQARPGAAALRIPPADAQANLRSEMAIALDEAGVAVVGHARGTASGGQAVIELAPLPLLAAADALMLAKYTMRNVAARHGKVVSFMPKPLFGEPGSGLALALEYTKDEALPIDPSGLSDAGRAVVGGLLSHAAGLAAFGNPTTNSYKRLLNDADAAVNLLYSSVNPAAFVHLRRHGGGAPPLVLAAPDASANPYLLLSGCCVAALDGLERRLDPGEPFERNLAELALAERAGLQTTPLSLEEALAGLQHDLEAFTRGGVFSADVLNHWISMKMNEEVLALAKRPTPSEFCMYFDV